MTTDERLKAIRQSLAGGWSVALCGPKDVVFLLAELDSARAKDAEAHAAALAAKDAEIARLRAQVDEYAHLRSIVELYRSDPMAMADALWRMRDDLGRLRSVVEEPHDVPPEERERA